MTNATANEIFAEPAPMPPIDFEPVVRDVPKSAEVAKNQIKNVKRLYDSTNVPQAMNRDLTLESCYGYVKAMKLLEDQAKEDIKWLKKIDPSKLSSDKFEAQSLESDRLHALSRLEEYLPKDIAFSKKYTQEFIESSIAEMQWGHIQKAADVDMSNSSEVSRWLGRQSLNEAREQTLRRLLGCFASAKLFDETFGTDTQYGPKKEKFMAMVKTYQSKLEQAADAIQPPKDLGKPELKTIAAEVLANKKYKLPKPVRIIVNADKKSHGKDHYTVDFSERSIEKSAYRWEEFQVATIEKEGDQHYLYYNTILYYEVGPHTVPTKKWVLGPRHKSAPISEKNINN